jgi:hypothetical protein
VVITTPGGYLVWMMSRARWRALQKIWHYHQIRFLSWGLGIWEATATYGCQTVVWRTCEGEQVDFRGWFGDGDFAGGADGDFEESGSHDD